MDRIHQLVRHLTLGIHTKYMGEGKFISTINLGIGRTASCLNILEEIIRRIDFIVTIYCIK